MHTVCIRFAMPRICNFGFSRAVTRVFTCLFAQNQEICSISKKWAYSKSCLLLLGSSVALRRKGISARMSAFMCQEAAPGETEFVALAAGEDRVRGRNAGFPCGTFLLCSGNTTLLKLADSHVTFIACVLTSRWMFITAPLVSALPDYVVDKSINNDVHIQNFCTVGSSVRLVLLVAESAERP